MQTCTLRGALLGTMLFVGVAGAVVPDPQIMTDHPVYRGELSCSTLDRNIADAYRIYADRYGHEPQTDTEKLIALWIWKCEHFIHSADNLIYVGPDHMDARRDEPANGWMDSRDCQMTQFSFGFALCYSVHAQMSALVSRALGDDLMRVRCPTVPGHTPFEAYVDGRWVLADFTTAMMVFDDEGKPLGIRDIEPYAKAKDTKWLEDPKRGGPYRLKLPPYPDSWDVYAEFKESQMLFGYNAMPIVYSLRAGESFTRYLEPGLEDGQTYMFWAKDYYNIGAKPIHGPHRYWTYLDSYPIGDNRQGKAAISQSNGVFEYHVPIADGRYREGVRSEKDTVVEGGVLRGKAAGAQVVFEHASPYIIAAWPEKRGDREWDLLREKCVDGAVATGKATGPVPVKVSLDGGQTWKDAGTAEGDFRVDFTDLAKGRHQYLVRFDLSEQAGIEALTLRTVTQIGRGVIPRLKDDGTQVTFQAGGQHVIHGGPSQYLAEGMRRKDLEEQEDVRVYEIQAPGPIRFATGMFRASGPTRGPWWVEFSTDGGKTWKKTRKDVTLTAEDSQWGGGHHAFMWADLNLPDNKTVKSVLVRFSKGKFSHAEVYATYAGPSDSAMEVTYNWTEGDQAKEHKHTIAAGKAADTWTVPTGKDVKTKWVRFAAK